MTIFHIGFTGTRFRLSLAAKYKLLQVIPSLMQGTFRHHFHHGDCINADAVASSIALHFSYTLHCHPPKNPKFRAFTKYNHYVYPEKDYIDRNHDIVDASGIMIATPATENEVLRSGTWATIRYARKLKKELCIIFPDGSIRWENSDKESYRTTAT